jgi:hypothetical protein
MTLQQPSTNHHTRTPTMTTNPKLKLIGLSTTIALLALPVSDALAGRSFYY